MSIQPKIYRAMPARHFEGSSTPSHAKETPTARQVKKIVIFGLWPVSHDPTEKSGSLRTSMFHNQPMHQ